MQLTKGQATHKLVTACEDLVTRIVNMVPSKEVQSVGSASKTPSAWLDAGVIYTQNFNARDRDIAYIKISGADRKPLHLLDAPVAYYANMLEGLILLHGMVEALPEIADGRYSKAMGEYERFLKRVTPPTDAEKAAALCTKAEEDKKRRSDEMAILEQKSAKRRRG